MSSNELNQCRVTINLDQSTRDLVEREADALGLSISAYARMVLRERTGAADRSRAERAREKAREGAQKPSAPQPSAPSSSPTSPSADDELLGKIDALLASRG